MTIPFTCPHCGAYSQVAESYAGMTGPCAQCGKTITIPATPAVSAKNVAAPQAIPPTRRRVPWMWLVLVGLAVCLLLLCGGGISALLIPAMRSAREGARLNQCQENLLQISAALESYHTDFGCYPPAFIPAADGTPRHSWRALVLRYLDEKLADEYDFKEPWDSPKNQRLWHRMPEVFACPSNPDGLQQYTSYVAVVGPGLVFTGAKPTNATQFPNPGSTVAMAEVAGHVKIRWLEPTDLPAAALLRIGDRSHPSVSSNHIDGANVAYAGVQVSFLPDAKPSP